MLKNERQLKYGYLLCLKVIRPKIAKILLQKVVKLYKRLKNFANLLNKSVLNLATLLI